MRSGVTQPQSNERERSSHLQISADAASDEIVNINVEMKNGVPVITTTGSHYHKGKIKKSLDGWRQKILGGLLQIRCAHHPIRSRRITLDAALFGLVILVYISTRLIGLVDFPIYFFTDEAVQTVQAADLVRDGFQNSEQEFLPTYFLNGSQYNLSLSVYMQVIPYLLFGKSEPVARTMAVLSTLVGAIGIGLIFRDIFKKRYWWLATLVLSVTPAWFLHSRTAFETALMVSMYTGFLYFYLRYRYISPSSLYPAIVFAALAFYAYSGAQVVMAVTGVLIVLTDLPYHWRNKKTCLIGLGILVILTLPYVRFLIDHATANYNHLQILGSYWTEPIPLSEKLARYFSYYLQGLNPVYWFLPNNHDLPRHLMKGYGNLLPFTFPFAILGLGISILNIRTAKHRLVLISLLAAPSGAAVVGTGITRLLVFIIPAAMMTSLGVWACLDWLEKLKVPQTALACGLFIPLAAFNFYMLNDALVNGPLWYSDYGLGGMQYGARQIFSEAQDYLQKFPETHIILSPSWANGTDVVARFFLPDSTPIELGSIKGFVNEHKLLDQNTLFIMTPQEFTEVQESNKFKDIKLEKTLPYPDGNPGFYFVRLNYVDDIDQIFEAEKQARSMLQTGAVTIKGEESEVSYSTLDMGDIQNVFDKNEATLIRSLEANPMVIELGFNESLMVKGLTIKVGGVPTRVTAVLQVPDAPKPLYFKSEVPETPLPKDVALDFGKLIAVDGIHLEVLNIYDGEPAHVHVWEITIK